MPSTRQPARLHAIATVLPHNASLTSHARTLRLTTRQPTPLGIHPDFRRFQPTRITGGRRNEHDHTVECPQRRAVPRGPAHHGASTQARACRVSPVTMPATSTPPGSGRLKPPPPPRCRSRSGRFPARFDSTADLAGHRLIAHTASWRRARPGGQTSCAQGLPLAE